MSRERRSWAEINLDRLKSNFEIIRSAANGADIMAVVKADAYGHGDIECARAFIDSGAKWLAVSGVDEALHLRGAGLEAPILILGYTPPSYARVLCEHSITQTVMSCEYAQELSASSQKAGYSVRVHIKLDTGMSRLGINAFDNVNLAVREISEIMDMPNLICEGLFTHFAVADSSNKENKAYTELQHSLLEATLAALRKAGRNIELTHCCNSAGLCAYAQYTHDLVRPGIILYGENPSNEVRLAGLAPAMCLKAAVAQVKTLGAGHDVSYGRRYTTTAPTRIATLAVGYADGYPRSLSNVGVVSIHSKPCRVIGTVCMDQMMVDITDAGEVRAGDEAIIFGGEGADSAEDIANKAGTIVYEILCGISRRVPRIYVSCGAEVNCVDYLSN